MCNDSTVSLELPRSSQGRVFDLGGLYAAFDELTDGRKARGKRYVLAVVLVVMVLAKLCGEDHPYGIAQWAQAWAPALSGWLALRRPRLPGHNTYRRVLREAVSPQELTATIRRFLMPNEAKPADWLICIDGKTLRGTIASGDNQGVHLLAAYMPHEGIVLMQVAVDRKENELVAAPRLLASLDLRGKVVLGDALFTQRELSIQIVSAGGDYVWLVKGNQPQVQEAIRQLFDPDPPIPGADRLPNDYQVATTRNKGHGRLEVRVLTSSTLLNDYLHWPYLAQVFRIERRITRLCSGQQRQEVVYGLTSLTRSEASAHRLLQMVREYWQIENGLHYRRDRTLHEDATRMRSSTQAENMATLNNLAIAIMLRTGCRYIPQTRRYYAGHPDEALRVLLTTGG